jgi:hypothetical protein
MSFQDLRSGVKPDMASCGYHPRTSGSWMSYSRIASARLSRRGYGNFAGRFDNGF